MANELLHLIFLPFLVVIHILLQAFNVLLWIFWLPIAIFTWVAWLLSPIIVPILLVIVILLILPYVWHFTWSLIQLAGRLIVLPFELFWEPFAWLINYYQGKKARSGGTRKSKTKKRTPSRSQATAKRSIRYEDEWSDVEHDEPVSWYYTAASTPVRARLGRHGSRG
ncbi:hypothetical protein B0T21DRAFT_441310 [Apiosordaria backusii]|uniref:Uncharacterized protein n=1 Tax=Apiosordaria backusii TaxID=314023 RepID=A0AA40BLX9_9PEZI|nr:hypothetical protein B0T21DRAFT_441310 [Apiosordaria backusii]